MARRFAAGVITLASAAHMATLLFGVHRGWFSLTDGSVLLLIGAFVLSLLALVTSVWVLRTEEERQFLIATGFLAACGECGRGHDPEHSFCVSCGAQA